MEVFFKNERLADLINSQEALRRKFGPHAAKAIMRRMAVLKAARTLAEVSHLPPEKGHKLTGNRKGQFAVAVSGGLRIAFEPLQEVGAEGQGGGTELAHIRAITILAVEDYHP